MSSRSTGTAGSTPTFHRQQPVDHSPRVGLRKGPGGPASGATRAAGGFRAYESGFEILATQLTRTPKVRAHTIDYMEITEAVKHRVEVREYADRPVEEDAKRAILDAARLAPSGKNSQHWRFLLVDDADDVQRLADLSTTGGWVGDAAFAVVVLTDPGYPYHELDAGRAITHAQFAAFDRGIGSCIYTGLDDAGMRDEFGIPDEYAVTAVVGFGYPEGSGEGRKRRRALGEVAFRGRFGEPFESGE